MNRTEPYIQESLAIADTVPNRGNGMSDQDLLRAFFVSRLARNVRQATLRCYSQRLKILVRFARLLGRGLTELGRADFERWVVAASESSLSRVTINGYLRAWRVFYGYLASEELIDGSPMAKVSFLRVDYERRQVIPPHQLCLLLDSFDVRTFTGCRNRNIALVLYDSMIRVGELCNAAVADLDLVGGTIHVRHTKSRRDRVVPISTRTVKSLNSYMVRFRKRLPGDLLFPYRDGRRMEEDQVRRTFARHGKRLGIERCYPHLLQHSGATAYLAAGGTVGCLQRILGHSDIRVTMMYDQRDDREAKREHSRFSPVAHLPGNGSVTNGVRIE